jgi:hypothetical protein
MYKKEEEKLLEYKNMYDKISISEASIDDAIMSGFQKAKLEQHKGPRRQYKWLYSFVAAAVLLGGFFTSVRLSPALANYVTVIPGMEKIVDLIRFDKGQLSAIENDYYQEIGLTKEKNGVKMTLDGAITDDTGMVLFYTIHSAKKQGYVTVDNVQLKSQNSEKLPISGASYGSPGLSEGDVTFTGTVEFYFQSPLPVKNLELSLTVNGETKEEYSFPFTLEKNMVGKKSYDMNQTVVIEGQKITFLSATIHPLRVALHLKMDPNNTKKILNFDDLRLVDETGETWNKITNGITATPISKEEMILYLQSNYFRQPEELYLALNHLQAIDKDEEWVKVDVVNEKILQQPAGNYLNDVKIAGDYLTFTMVTEEEFPSYIFGKILDHNGKEINSNSFLTSTRDEKNIKEFGIEIPNLLDHKDAVSLEITSYPSWIKGDVKIRLK